MHERELKLAILAVKKSEPTFRKYFGKAAHVTSKGGDYRNLVSASDLKIEQEIKNFLIKAFPAYGFLGEEKGGVNQKAKMQWVLDPIDGTNNYIRGLSDCSISLALLKNQKAVLGIVYAPFLNQLYTAVAGQKAKLNGKSIRAAKSVEIKKAFGAIGWGRELKFAAKTFPKLLPKVLTLRVASSAALTLCQVAAGSFHFFLTKNMKLWDYAAGKIIVEEAGGKCFIDQKSLTLIAGNKNMVGDLQKLLNLNRLLKR